MVFRRRFRSGNNLRPVNRIKHVVDVQGALTAAATVTQFLVTAVDNPVIANTGDVQTGSTVNAIYLKVEIASTALTALTNFYIYVAKNPGNNLVLPVPNVVGSSDNKKYVIHQEMVMTQNIANGNPRTVFNGVIVIPKGYRRFGPDDRLSLVLHAPANTYNFCIQCHYKEFR